MAYYVCNDCQKYDRNDINRYDEAYCTYYCKYFPKSDRACSKFEKRNDIETTCFLTTAICDIFGYTDNCFGLETLRNFRDNVLVKDSRFYHLLAEYEVVGPIISQKLYNDEHRMEVAEYYFENYLYDIIVNLNTEKDYMSAVETYIVMVNELKRMYEITKKASLDDIKVLTRKIENGEYKVKNRG